MVNDDIPDQRTLYSERVDAARRRAIRTNPWYPLILGLVLLPIGFASAVWGAIEVARLSPGALFAVALLAACLAPLVWAWWLFRHRGDVDPGITVVRLWSATGGAAGRSAVTVDDSNVVIYAPKVLSREWVIPKRDVAFISGDGTATNPPAVFPRLVPVVVNPEFPLNTLLFFLTPQRIVPLKAAGGGMPFGVRETALGVWADGCILGLESRKSGRAALLESGLRCFGSLTEAAANAYGTVENPHDPNRFQLLTEDSSDEVLTGPGDFWRHAEPVRRLRR